MTLTDEQRARFDEAGEEALREAIVSGGEVNVPLVFYLTRCRPEVLKRALDEDPIGALHIEVIRLITAHVANATR